MTQSTTNLQKLNSAENLSAGLRGRANLTERQGEDWRPPIFKPIVTPQDRMIAAARRYFDVQAGSAWNDLSVILPKVKGSLLDVGCGAQPFRSLMPSDVRYTGIDTEDAGNHFGYEVPDTIYFTGEVWPLENQSLDNILCTETLEHVLEPCVLLREAYRCLRPGGQLILTVPFAARWHFIPHDYWRYTPSSLKHLLQTTGFEQITVYARGNALTVACYKTMALFLPLLFSPASNPLALVARRIGGVISLPLLVVLAVIANLSLKLPGGDDCLGYTALAVRPS